MGLRPVPARWFQVLAVRNDVSRVAEVLAQTGLVQIEAGADAVAFEEVNEIRDSLREYDQLARRYHPYWPDNKDAPSGPPAAPIEVASRALECLRQWTIDAAPRIAHLERTEHENADVALLLELFDAAGDDMPRLARLRKAGPTLAGRLFALPLSHMGDVLLPSQPLVHRVMGSTHAFFVVLAAASADSKVQQALAGEKAREVAVPHWLPDRGAKAKLRQRMAELDAEADDVRAALRASHVRHDLGAALSDLRRLRWFSRSVPELPQTRNFAVVTGWTRDQGGEVLRAALDHAGAPALLDFPEAPAEREPPILLNNPKWLKPFETFPRLLGTPARYEADPSPVLAVFAPILFGFMFGDVGQGAVLVLLGLLLRKRSPAAALLIPGGGMAIIFGVVFGSVFASENVIAPLWVHPLNSPLQLLAVSVIGGAVILLVGLLLGSLEASWRGSLRTWFGTDAALILIYIGLLGMVLDLRVGLAAIAGVVWHLIGSGLSAERSRLGAAARAAGHLIERMLQLLVNTVSFARVGAFALAHAGLCSAIEGLSHAAGGVIAAAMVLVLGNAFTIALEGLVVSIQTTRLLLFEFFARFLRGEGRAFHPLMPPAAPGPDGQGVAQ